MIYNDYDVPFLEEYSLEEENELNRLFGDNYIVDPLPNDQALAFIYDTLSKRQRKRFDKKFNVVKIRNDHDRFLMLYTMNG